MKYSTLLMLLFVSLFSIASCNEQEQVEEKTLPSKVYNYVEPKMMSELAVHEKVYLPIYSEIYHMTGEKRFPLTATVSVRNTHEQAHLYVDRVDYFDSQGKLVKSYLKSPIDIKPLESVEFVVADKEAQGGAGANFIIQWGSDQTDINPIFQAIMISTRSSQGISFVTNGQVMYSDRRSIVKP